MQGYTREMLYFWLQNGYKNALPKILAEHFFSQRLLFLGKRQKSFLCKRVRLLEQQTKICKCFWCFALERNWVSGCGQEAVLGFADCTKLSSRIVTNFINKGHSGGAELTDLDSDNKDISKAADMLIVAGDA